MADHLQVITTLPGKEEAIGLARMLVDRRLAACAQVIGPITSVYRWKGAVETAEEYQCVLKTRADRYAELEEAIRGAHPYEVPEILATPVAAGLQSYLSWVDEEAGA